MDATSSARQHLAGLFVLDPEGEVLLSIGAGGDSRVRAMARTPEWMEEAREKRVMPIRLNDAELIGVLLENEGAVVMMLFDSPGDTLMNFLASVDFAWDIFEHVLTDPYDSMVVTDVAGKTRYLSPVHEKFFGLQPGAGVGKTTRDIIPNSRLHHVAQTGVAEVGQVLNMGKVQRIVSRHPIFHDGEIVGAIGRVMFKGPAQLEEMAKRISLLEQQVARYQAKEEREQKGERHLEALIGQSVAIESVRQQIRKIAPLDVPVLIQGESGTGKELVASALHMLSERRDARLITVNAAALPPNLVESELFGYEAGSFTGANRKGRPGKFELADRGTIFLDEIGDMPLEVQAKLLRVLQERTVERVGSERPKHVDFRLCSATNHNLEELVDEGKFRLDLFYRISPVCITLPPLSERLEDIPLLLHHFVDEFEAKYGMANVEVDVDVPGYLMAREWPGNIRQLRHEVERAFVFAENGLITVQSFGDDGRATKVRKEPGKFAAPAPTAARNTDGTIKDAVDQLEREMIEDAMARFSGNKKKVATHLGVSRSYLYKKLEELDVLSGNDD